MYESTVFFVSICHILVSFMDWSCKGSVTLIRQDNQRKILLREEEIASPQSKTDLKQYHDFRFHKMSNPLYMGLRQQQ